MVKRWHKLSTRSGIFIFICFVIFLGVLKITAYEISDELLDASLIICGAALGALISIKLQEHKRFISLGIFIFIGLVISLSVSKNISMVNGDLLNSLLIICGATLGAWIGIDFQRHANEKKPKKT